MKKLGILGVLVLLVALAFVPQGVMAVTNNTANLTINADVLPSIELFINVSGVIPYDPIEDTYGTHLSLTPNSEGTGDAVEKVELADALQVFCNKDGWSLQVAEYSTDAFQLDGKMNSSTTGVPLTNPLQVGKIDTQAGETSALNTYMDLTNSPKDLIPGLVTVPTTSSGSTLPIGFSQSVTYSDVVATDYTITVTYIAGIA